MNDSIAEAYAMKGDYDSSIPYLKASIEIVKNTFGEESIEAGNEYFKLAQVKISKSSFITSQVLFNSKQVVDALNVVEKAKGVLQRYYNSNNERLLELEEMRRCLLGIMEKTVGPYWAT